MVKVREEHPIRDDGSVDLERWLESIQSQTEKFSKDELRRACLVAEQAEREAIALDEIWGSGLGSYRTGLEMAQILAGLRADQDTLVAAVLYRAVREGRIPLRHVADDFGEDVAGLIEGVMRMAAIGAISNPTRKAVLGQQQGQLDNVRKMLVAMVDDVRVALIKLAERTCIIRGVKNADEERQRKVAREVFDIYAPLAHRLGVGHIKWELEDLAFRYLQPGAYKKIAKLLDEKRAAREQYIVDVVEELRRQLDRAGIQGEVYGRAKHIYSIWRKMQKKQIDFYEVYDVRAVRILVPEVRDCYAVLGIVHSLWQHVPKEFDDYIATPKPNGYQSLHTAVIGPDRKVLEVQIRTFAMHDAAELGIAAHWRYKEGGRAAKVTGYEHKIAWLRQVLEWHDQLGDAGVADIIKQEVSLDRVYVFTPDGHVVDLAAGATPVDFAYGIHTEVGHRCRGAKVNGRIVTLNTALHTGEQVEIITAKEGGPSRDWLNPTLGFVKTSGARAKIQHWFRQRDRDENIAGGREMLERELKRLALDEVNHRELAARLGQKQPDDMYALLGSGDLKISQVVHQLQAARAEQAQGEQQDLLPRAATATREGQGVLVEGVGNLMTHMAGCCQPVPGDAILGYVTAGRGVTVHRVDCEKLLAMQRDDPARIVEVSWGVEADISYPVDIFVKAWDRTGLLRDIMFVLAAEKVNITAAHTQSSRNDNTATMLFTIEIGSLNLLGRVLGRIEQLPSVLEVHRYKK
ncbi:MAG: GTP diphosphokinase [Gammaproteobacteria bacterium]